MSKENVKRVLDRLEGTLIADLESLKLIAEERTRSSSLKEKLPGGLNFSLFITGLIACETIGYFINKTSEEGRSKDNIEYFVSSNYFKVSPFKKRNYLSALVSLRTNLVHVFGMTDLELDEIDTDLELIVGGSNEPEVIPINGVRAQFPLILETIGI